MRRRVRLALTLTRWAARTPALPAHWRRAHGGGGGGGGGWLLHLYLHAHARAQAPAVGFVVNNAPAPTSSPIPCPSPPPLRRRRCRRLLRPPPRLSDLLLLRHWLGVLAGQRWQEEAYSAIESPSGSARGVQQYRTISECQIFS